MYSKIRLNKILFIVKVNIAAECPSMYALRFYKYIINKGSINNYVDMGRLIGGQ